MLMKCEHTLSHRHQTCARERASELERVSEKKIWGNDDSTRLDLNRLSDSIRSNLYIQSIEGNNFISPLHFYSIRYFSIRMLLARLKNIIDILIKFVHHKNNEIYRVTVDSIYTRRIRVLSERASEWVNEFSWGFE